ncbi:MAG: hypothetical protein HUK25_09300 [Treponema sp.]|nr:hypothetical protein [Treponema sp.]
MNKHVNLKKAVITSSLMAVISFGAFAGSVKVVSTESTVQENVSGNIIFSNKNDEWKNGEQHKNGNYDNRNNGNKNKDSKDTVKKQTEKEPVKPAAKKTEKKEAEKTAVKNPPKKESPECSCKKQPKKAPECSCKKLPKKELPKRTVKNPPKKESLKSEDPFIIVTPKPEVIHIPPKDKCKDDDDHLKKERERYEGKFHISITL